MWGFRKIVSVEIKERVVGNGGERAVVAEQGWRLQWALRWVNRRTLRGRAGPSKEVHVQKLVEIRQSGERERWGRGVVVDEHGVGVGVTVREGGSVGSVGIFMLSWLEAKDREA